MRLVLALFFLWPWIAQAASFSVPQMVDGSNWKTTLTVFARSGRTARIDIQFFGNDGKPLALPIVGWGSVTTVHANLGPFDSATFETEGTSDTLSEGWAHVESDSEIGGVSVIRLRTPGQPDAEAAVPLTVAGPSVVSNFDNTSGLLTGIALVNHGFGPVSLYFGFTAEGGQTIGSRVVVLNAKHHTSFLLSERFPEVAGKRGTVQITGLTSQNTVDGSISVLGLRFSPKGSFTTLPFFVPLQR